MTTPPWVRPLTAVDLWEHPFGADARRYELVDGEVPVTPSPTGGHQSVLSRLVEWMLARCPDRLRAGVPSHWVVDPDAGRVVASEHADGRYVEVADVSGEDEWRATAPYPVALRPADLLR